MKSPVKYLFLLLISLITSYTAIAAVSISQNQTGQAIVVPYFTVANGLNTLVSINNTQDQPKAIKINIREGRQGSAMYSFNLYLDANDIWTFAMFAIDEELLVFSHDQSCTINLDSSNPTPPTGTDTSTWDWHTGMIEIIEMGNVLTESNNFFNFPSAEENCDQLNNAWYANGPNSFWQAESTAELSAVSGGISADISVINVVNGFAFKVPPLIMDDFFPTETIYHREPESTEPNLSSGSQESLLIYDGVAVQTTWPTGYEAVSALILKTTVENEFDVTSSVGAVNEWVLSFPTLAFHKNNVETQKPFIFENTDYFRFPGTPSSSYLFYDRESTQYQVNYGCVLPPPGVYCPPVHFLNHAVNTYVVNPIFFEPPDSTISGPSNEHIQGLDIVGAIIDDESFTSGKAKLIINTVTDDERWSPAYAHINDRGINSVTDSPQSYHGLPVLGFAVQIYRNSNAQPGLLATYASAKPHQGERLITDDNE